MNVVSDTIRRLSASHPTYSAPCSVSISGAKPLCAHTRETTNWSLIFTPLAGLLCRCSISRKSHAMGQLFDAIVTASSKSQTFPSSSSVHLTSTGMSISGSELREDFDILAVPYPLHHTPFPLAQTFAPLHRRGLGPWW